MTNKDFQKMIRLFSELDELIKEFEAGINSYSKDEPKPLMIPDDVYDEICSRLKIKEIVLLGIS